MYLALLMALRTMLWQAVEDVACTGFSGSSSARISNYVEGDKEEERGRDGTGGRRERRRKREKEMVEEGGGKETRRKRAEDTLEEGGGGREGVEEMVECYQKATEFKEARHQCCVYMTRNTPSPSHPGAAEEA